jgi:hypothetical protein
MCEHHQLLQQMCISLDELLGRKRVKPRRTDWYGEADGVF